MKFIKNWAFTFTAALTGNQCTEKPGGNRIQHGPQIGTN